MKTPVSESLTLLTAVPNLAFASGMLSRFARACHRIGLYGLVWHGTKQMKLPRKLGKEPLIEAIARSSAVESSIVSFYSTLLESRFSAEQIDSKLTAIRRQHVTSLFFLPHEGQLAAEYIAILDDIHTIPLQVFQKEPQR